MLTTALLVIARFLFADTLPGMPSASFDSRDADSGWYFNNGQEFPGATGDMAWTATAGHERPGCLRVRFSFEGGGNYVQAGWNFPRPQDARALSVWLKKPTGHHITFRATDSKDQTFQKTLRYDFPDWQQIEVDLGQWTSHWGGPNDGKITYPLKAVGILVENSGEPRKGELFIDDVRLLERPTATRRADDIQLRPDIKESGDEITFSAELKNKGATARGRLVCEYRNLNGRLGTRSAELELAGNGATTRQEFVFPRGRDHLVDACFRWVQPGTEIPPACIGTSLPLENAGSSAIDESSVLGCGLYLYRWQGNPQARENMIRLARLAQAAGIKWTREEFQWQAIEPREGTFKFDFYDQLLDIHHDHGISVYGLLCYWAPWAKANTPEGIEQYCRWVRQVVRRYKSKVHYWEIWNEPNIFFWTGPKELYAELLTKAYEAVKAEDPGATVIGCSTSGIDTKFIQMVMDKGGRFDALSIHPYRGQLDDLRYVEELRHARKLVGGRDVWLTEIGYPSQLLTGWSERSQASLAARTYLLSVASGAIRDVSWYDFRNDGNDAYYNENNFGVVRSDFRLKPAYRALATTCHALRGMTVKAEIKIADGVYAYRFSDGHRDLIAACAPTASRLLSFKSTEKLTVIDGVGQPIEPQRDAERATVTLVAGFPLYMTGPRGFTWEAADPPVRLLADRQNVRPGDSVNIRIEPAQAVERWDLPEGWSVQADKVGTGSIRIPTDALTGKVDVTAQVGKSATLRLPLTLNVVPVLIRC